jgi:CarD family transcriptional regulator
MMVPFSHVGDVGLRKVRTTGEWARVLSFLSSGRCARCRDWKDRFKQNSEKMRAGEPLQLAEVLKSLLLLQREKPLSFREKRMLDQARQMLMVELSIARGLAPEDAQSMLRGALAKATLELPPPR